jgi:AraC-like DNA-binding protein
MTAMQPATPPLPPGHAVLAERGANYMWPYHVHSHACYELIIMTGHRGQLVVDDHQGSFQPGMAFLLAPGVAHSFHSEQPYPEPRWGISRPTDLSCELVYFHPRLVDPAHVPELTALAPLLSRARLGLSFAAGSEAVARVRELVQGVVATSFPPARIAGLIAALGLLAGAGGEALAEHGAASPYRDEDMIRLEALRELLRRRFREPMSLDQAALAIGVSASTVNHLLAKYARTTFLRMLSDLRLDEAKHLLRDTSDDITSIAFAAGFGSLATFNRRFRREVGVAPHEYRLQPPEPRLTPVP